MKPSVSRILGIFIATVLISLLGYGSGFHHFKFKENYRQKESSTSCETMKPIFCDKIAVCNSETTQDKCLEELGAEFCRDRLGSNADEFNKCSLDIMIMSCSDSMPDSCKIIF